MRRRLGREVWEHCVGAVSTEYVLLVAVVGVPLAVLLTALAPRMTDHYARERSMLSRPFP